jgi:lipoate-protein ligase A
MNECYWLDLAPRAAADQMAIDTAMVGVARSHEVSILRLYRWLEDTVSFGANEAVLRHWNRPLFESDATACVRRPTGGRAVWHGMADLTYSWTGPAANPAEVRSIYRDLHERLATAIAASGRTVVLAAQRTDPGLGAGACFDVPVGGEVLVDGRKVIGSAQRVYGDRLLQHGAIALRADQHRLGRYRITDQAPMAVTNEVSLDDADAIATAIGHAWQRAGVRIAPEELTSSILLASVEYRTHYLDPAWTWRR